MFPSLSDYHYHSKKYSQAISELEFEYAFAKNDRKRYDLLNKFSDKYLMPIELWVIVKELIEKLKMPPNTLQDKVFFNFCNDPRIFKNLKALRYILQQENRPLWSNLKSLTFPHSKLDQDLMDRERHADEPLFAAIFKRVEKLKLLFWEIKAKQDNIDEWFDALKEAENLEFLKINVEHRLSFRLWDKKLWILYINYLGKHDISEMLQTYSKYCRFFMDDEKMIEEYNERLKKYGCSRVPWKNRFKNEKPPISSINPLYDTKEEEDDEDAEDEFYIENIDMNFKLQLWSIPHPIIRYIMLTANPTVLRKLHRSCKYFFVKKPKLFCYQFFCADYGSQHTRYKKESIDYMVRLFLPFHLKNLHITTSFTVAHSNSFLVTRLIKNVVVECTAKYVELLCQIITVKELKFLIGHGNVEYFKLYTTTILNATKDDKENNMVLEDILQMVPKIRSFHNDQVFTSANTFKVLAEMKFVNKILQFDVEIIQDDFHTVDFCEFFKKNAALYSTFKFRLNNTDEKVQELEKAVNDCFDIALIDGKPLYYSFPKPIINYMLKTASAIIYFKLFQTCKLLQNFIDQKCGPQIDVLEVGDFRKKPDFFLIKAGKKEIKIRGHEICYNFFSTNKKLMVRNRLMLNFLQDTTTEKLLQKLNLSMIKEIYLLHSAITVEDYKNLLVPSIEKVYFSICVTRDGFDVIAYTLTNLPNLKIFKLPFYRNLTTFTELNTIKRENKLQKAEIYDIPDIIIDKENISAFIAKQMSPGSTLHLCFRNGVPQGTKNKYQQFADEFNMSSSTTKLMIR